MRAIVLASLAWIAPACAFAEPALVDQVERLDVEGGETEFEWQSVLADATGGQERTTIHVLSGEYGLNDRVSLGFELGAEDEDGEALEAEYLMLQAKVVLLDPAEHGLGFGVQASVGPSLNGGEAEAELEILAERQAGVFSLAADIALEAELEDFSEGAARYALRGAWRQSFGAIGIETGGDIDAAPDEAHRHWIGPVLGLRAHDRFMIELSYLSGLTEDTPDGQLRVQLTLS
jgi:hypothetical protein